MINLITENDLGNTLTVQDGKASVRLSNATGNALITKDDGLFVEIPTGSTSEEIKFTNLRGVFASNVLIFKDILGESVMVGMNKFSGYDDSNKEIIDYETGAYIFKPDITVFGNYKPYVYYESKESIDPEVIFDKDSVTYRNKEFSLPYYTEDGFLEIAFDGNLATRKGAEGFKIFYPHSLFSRIENLMGLILINDTGQTHKLIFDDESTHTTDGSSYEVDVSSILPSEGLISSLYLAPIPEGATSETITKRGDTYEVRYTMKNSQIMTTTVPRLSSLVDNI